MTTPESPPTITTANLWDLEAEPARLEAAAAAWRAMAQAAERAERTAVDAANHVIAEGAWEGDASESFHAHRARVMADVHRYADLVAGIAAVLEKTAGVLRHWQGWLTDDLASLTADVPVTVTDSKGSLTFAPADEAQAARVRQAIADVRDVRTLIDETLASGEAELYRLSRVLGDISETWRPSDGTIRVLNLNIGQGHGNSPGDYSGTDGAGPDITALAELIANDGANVATLQEAFGRDMPRLQEELERITGDTWNLHYQEASDKFYASTQLEEGAVGPPGVPQIPIPIPNTWHTETDVHLSASFGNAVLVRESGPIATSELTGHTKLDDPGDGGILDIGGPEGRSMPHVAVELDNE